MSNSDLTDVHDLTSAIVSGDPEAFARLYKARFNYMYQVARKVTQFDEAMCLDIVQDAMMRVTRYIKPLDDGRALDNWLACVSRSVAYDHLRRERRRRIRERKAMDGRTDIATDDTQEILGRITWVRRELRGLDRAAQELIELRFRAGMTLEAIGLRLGISAGTVHRRLTKAIARLRRRTSTDE